MIFKDFHGLLGIVKGFLWMFMDFYLFFGFPRFPYRFYGIVWKIGKPKGKLEIIGKNWKKWKTEAFSNYSNFPLDEKVVNEKSPI